MAKSWMGGTVCDFCKCDVTKEPWFVDGRTTFGPWALMCPEDWRNFGVKTLGTGMGQKYDGPTKLKMEG